SPPRLPPVRTQSTGSACSCIRPRCRSSGGRGSGRRSPRCVPPCSRISPRVSRASPRSSRGAVRVETLSLGSLCPSGVRVLQGTFETLSLTEVLGLLTRSHKSGALILEAGPATGVVHVADGRCYAAESAEQRGAVEHASGLLVRLVDVCFGVA